MFSVYCICLLIFLDASILVHSSSTVTYEEVKNLPPGVYLIDVREPEEIKQTGLIPGSINIPKGNVKSELTDLNEDDFLNKYGLKKPNMDSVIIFTCQIGKRAEEIMKEMEKLGYSNLKYYPGSWQEWEKSDSNTNSISKHLLVISFVIIHVIKYLSSK